MLIHVVAPGETPSSIATGYGVDPTRLVSDNSVPPDGALAVGQTLVIRFPQTIHVVRPGETLASIAAGYGVSVRQLWRNNWELGGQTILRSGQELVISHFENRLGAALFNSYAYPFISPPLLDAQLPFLSAMAPFTYGIGAQGQLLPLDDEALIAAARQHGTAPVMHLSTLTEDERFDTQRAIAVLTNDALQTRLIDETLQTFLAKGYQVLDVDFEYLPGYLAGAYAAFLTRLRQRLAPYNAPLWAALAPKTSAGQRGLLYEGHDYAAIGAAVDAVLLMTYEWGYTAGPPMAVSPLPNVRQVLDYAVTEIPRNKIFLGISNYGYDWPLPFVRGQTRAQSISNQRAIELAIQYNIAIQYDETAQAPFFHYTDSAGTVHEVWFEDARSLDVRLRLIAEYGLAGGGFWNMMRPFSQTWLVTDGLYNILE